MTTASGARVPEEVRGLFWDTDPARLDLDRHARFIIERILEFGDLPAVSWLLATYERDRVREAVEHSRRLSAKTRAFWRAYLLGQGKDRVAR